MREYFAYTRVSTIRQGEHGASLPQQEAVIQEYAKREGLQITRWFEERETAAKVGRTQFRLMLNLLRVGKAHGLLLHKIDRGARNLKDWGALSELSDGGVDVRIAGDSIDLNSRGGRLSADIQAVVAADYIRNLREEVKKGQRGRLGQGLYPWSAPVGYLNTGSGQEAKRIDPIMGPIVRRAFEEYATGKHTLHTLSAAMTAWGIATKGGKGISVNSTNLLLRRGFYTGLIEVKGQSYIGIHETLVPKSLFDQVQKILDGRSSNRIFGVASYALRGMLICTSCTRRLYAETQKGNAYFRCHSKSCKGTSLRESVVLKGMSDHVRTLKLSNEAMSEVEYIFQMKKRDVLANIENLTGAVLLKREQIRGRIIGVTDAYLDQQIDKDEHTRRRALLLAEEVSINHRLSELAVPARVFAQIVNKTLELGKDLQILENEANAGESVDIIKSAFSNFLVSRKSVEFEWKYPLQTAILAEAVAASGDAREAYRTIAKKEIFKLIDQLLEQHVLNVPTSGSPKEIGGLGRKSERR